MAKIFLRTQFPHNYNTNDAGDESGTDTGTEGGAKQSFKEECDINTIIKRFGLGYELPPTLREPQYGDFTNIPGSFHEAMNRVRQAQEAFDLLPADTRARFHNDPGQWHDFMIDAKNADEVEKMGALSQEAVERRAAARAEAEAQRQREFEAAVDAAAEAKAKGSKSSPAKP